MSTLRRFPNWSALPIPRERAVRGGAVVALVVAAVLAPVWLPTESRVDLARQALYAAALAATWSFIAGVAGQMNFAHMTLAGIGAYIGAIWGNDVGGSLGGVWVQMLMGVLGAVVVGTFLGILLLRFRGAYLCLFTLAFAELVRIVVIAEKEVTNGWLSLSSPSLGLNSTMSYFVVLGVLAFILVVIYATIRSRIGLFLRAMREDADAAAAMAVNTLGLKVAVFVGTSFLVGLAGTVYYHTVPRVTPELFDLIEMSLIVVYVVLGGLESPISAALGGIVMVFLLDALRIVNIGPIDIEPGIWRYAIFGALLVVTLRLKPNGLISPLVGWIARGGTRSVPPVAEQTVVTSAGEIGQRLPRAMPSRGVSLEVDNVSMRFGGLVALNGVSVIVDRPGIIGLIGPNGAGKTTLVNVLTGYHRPSGGAIVLDGARVDGLPPYEMAKLGLARTFQITRLFRRLSVHENLLVPVLALNGGMSRAEAERRARECLGIVHLGRLANEQAKNLSGGQQKLLEFARLLMLDTSILLLDEPFAGVHPSLRHTISDLIRRLREEGRVVILIEHDLSAVFELCERLIVLNVGSVVADGDPATVQRDPRVIEAYLGTSHSAAAATVAPGG